MNESDKLLDEWQDADESALSVEQEVLADMDEEKSISIFRLKLRRKLLEAQLHGDHSEDCKEEALFNEQVVLDIKDGEQTITDIDQTLSSLKEWRTTQQNTHHAASSEEYDGGPESDAEGSSRLLQFADQVMAQAAGHATDPHNADVASMERTLEELKHGHELMDDDEETSTRSQDNHTAALNLDFNRISYEAFLSSHDKALGLQQELLMQELQCDRDISSLVRQLGLLDDSLTSALLSSDRNPS